MRRVHDAIGLWQRITAFVRRRRIARDVDDELAFHLAMRQAEREQDGRAPDDARLEARRQFGNVTALAEETREMWTFPSFESLRQDVKFAIRTLRKSPGFTIVAVVALAIGIGANTAIFSLVDAMLLRGLPYADPDRLVVLIGNVQRATGLERRGNSYPDHLDWKKQTTTFDGMAAYNGITLTITGQGEPQRVNAESVSASYFSVFGVTPARGRGFRDEEDRPGGASQVVVLSDGLWTRAFGADPAILGKKVVVNGRPFDVIGVMPPGFTGISDQAEAWVTFVYSGYPPDSRGSRGFQTIARLKTGSTIEQARAELAGISSSLEKQFPETNDKRAVEISPLSVETFGQLRPVVLALMAAVTFVLLIACANVANLLISRSETRQREIAVRTALGAGRGRLMRQLVTESCVLALTGGLAGVALAKLALPTLIANSPIGVPTFADPRLNLPVLLFTLGASIVCGLVLGLAPSMHARITGLGQILKDSARGSSSASARRLRGALVVAEVALAVILLVGAALMIRTVQNIVAVDPAFATDHVLTLNLNVPREPAVAPAAPAAPGTPAPPPPPFVATSGVLLERLAAVPGVTKAALGSDVPLGPKSSAVFYVAEGDSTITAENRPRAYVHRVTASFFEALSIRLVSGRTFAAAETAPDSTAVIVSNPVVKRFWPGQDPIGKRIKIGAPNSENPWLTIVGVVPELKYRGLPNNPTADPDLFFPFIDRGAQGVVLRTGVDPASIGPLVRNAIREINPGIVVFGLSPLADLAAAQTAQSRFTTWLMGLFAATALLLATIGLYGVMSYLVTQRRREFGIRLALGATSREIVGVVLRDGTKMVGLGLIIGAAGAFGVARLLDALLYGVPSVAASAALAVSVLAVVAIAACLVPALRATRVDPVVALRNE